MNTPTRGEYSNLQMSAKHLLQEVYQLQVFLMQLNCIGFQYYIMNRSSADKIRIIIVFPNAKGARHVAITFWRAALATRYECLAPSDRV